VTWLVYQQIITAYAHPDPREGKPDINYRIRTLLRCGAVALRIRMGTFSGTP
jgi:hypothetical protein